MLNLQQVHKPRTIEEALELLKQPGTFALAGGTALVAERRKDVRALVDLAGLDLAYIRDEDRSIAIGATTLLEQLFESPILRAVANGVVAEAAHRSAASILRNQATVGGTLIAEPAGILATALLALDASLLISTADSSPGQVTAALLAEFLLHGPSASGLLVTAIRIPASSLGRKAALETVARTPSDKPIVSACAAVEVDRGLVRAAALALGGVASAALRAAPAGQQLVGSKLDPASIEAAVREACSKLEPPSDFRGSAEYRREMASVLLARALSDVRAAA